MRHLCKLRSSSSSLLPAAALAHAMLDHASPRVGSTVATAPKELMLWFTEKLEPAFSTAEVRNAQGAGCKAARRNVDRQRPHRVARAAESAAARDLSGDLACSIGGHPSHAGQFHFPCRPVGARCARDRSAHPDARRAFCRDRAAAGTVLFLALVAASRVARRRAAADERCVSAAAAWLVWVALAVASRPARPGWCGSPPISTAPRLSRSACMAAFGRCSPIPASAWSGALRLASRCCSPRCCSWPATRLLQMAAGRR